MKISQPQLLLLISLVSLTQTTILITSPAINPFDESKIPYVYTNVGSIPYGKTLTFDLGQKSDFDFCHNLQNITKSQFTDPTYVVIGHGQTACSFVTQAINAQSLGAKGILIVSDSVNYFENMVPIDDGNGRKVHISVLMISNQTYVKLKTLKNTQIKVQFEVYKSKTVNLEYFLSASGRANYIFLREFQPYYEKISFYVNFKPIYLTFSCPNCQQTQCLINSDYCLFEMDTYADGFGQYILKEQIRQWNIYKQFGMTKYFSYMNQFDKLCTVNWYDSQDCGNNILETMDLKSPSSAFSPSQLMSSWRKQEKELGFVTIPQLTINTELYAGTEDAEDVFNAICSYLLEPPAACLGQQQPQSKKGHKVGWIIASIIIACIVSIGLGMLIYKKCVKKELTKDMFSKVNQLVARYATKVSEHNKKRKEKLKMRLNEEL